MSEQKEKENPQQVDKNINPSNNNINNQNASQTIQGGSSIPTERIPENPEQQNNLKNQLNQSQLKMQTALNLDAMKRQQELNLGGQEELQTMNLENQRETMRIQREEMQRASRLQTEQTFLGAHQANLNAGVLNNAIDNGINAFQQQQPQMGGGMMGGMGAPQMPGMGGAPQMPGMGMKQATPQVSYMIGVNGQQAGPFDWNQLHQLVQQGQLSQQTYVWKQGMANWEFAGNVQELQPLFMNAAPPQMPGMPPMPGM